LEFFLLFLDFLPPTAVLARGAPPTLTAGAVAAEVDTAFAATPPDAGAGTTSADAAAAGGADPPFWLFFISFHFFDARFIASPKDPPFFSCSSFTKSVHFIVQLNIQYGYI
jgi:hypothetical protein